MKDFNTIEAVERNTFECMEWMENKIRDIIENLIKQNGENLYHADTKYDYGYCHGIHDGLLDVLNALEIETDEEYYN